jgi:hypothetical protein
MNLRTGFESLAKRPDPAIRIEVEILIFALHRPSWGELVFKAPANNLARLGFAAETSIVNTAIG